MPDDLGARLLRAGLVTRDQLGDTLASAPLHAGALVEALVGRGVPEDAIAGFFLAEGFGPLMDTGDLEKADPAALRRLPGAMAADLLALPVRASPAGLVVAMAAPSDRHAVRELARAVGSDVLPTVARVGALRVAIRAAFPEHGRQDAAAPDARDAPESEAPALELVRRRGEPRAALEPLGHTDQIVEAGAIKGTLGPKLFAEDDDEPALPLVRTKPQRTPAAGMPLPRRADGARVITKSFARPDSTRRVQYPGEAFVEARSTANYPVMPEEAPAPQPPASSPSAAASSPSTASSPSAAAAPSAAASPSAAAAPPRATRPASIVPPEHDRWDVSAPVIIAAKPAAPQGAPAKLVARASAQLPSPKPGPAEIGSVLSAMRLASDRDEVVRLACEGAVTVSRAAVFLALRKGVLKGWDAAGGNLSRDAVRNLWIPTTSASSFERVVERREAHVGPYGTAIADGLFRAAVASRGGDVMLHPVVVGDKVVGVLCADDVIAAPVGRQRIEILAHAVGEAFRRILSGKRG